MAPCAHTTGTYVNSTRDIWAARTQALPPGVQFSAGGSCTDASTRSWRSPAASSGGAPAHALLSHQRSTAHTFLPHQRSLAHAPLTQCSQTHLTRRSRTAHAPFMRQRSPTHAPLMHSSCTTTHVHTQLHKHACMHPCTHAQISATPHAFSSGSVAGVPPHMPP